MQHPIATASLLALAWVGGTPGSARAGECSSQPPLVDVYVMTFGSGQWSAEVCANGAFHASDGGGSYSKQLKAAEMGQLRALLTALPVGKKTYDFGEFFVDTPCMFLNAQVGGLARSYGIGASVKKEQGNRAFPPVARLAIFVRGLLSSKHALSAEEWFAEAMPRPE